MHYLPLISAALFIILGIGCRAWLHRRRYGTWGIVLLRSRDPGQILRDSFLVLLPVVLVGQATALAIWPAAVSGKMVIEPGELTGSAAILGGGALMVRAQLDLGASWRVGIDDRATPGLVTHGLYRLSRNPIFLGMLTGLAGLTLLIPTWLSFAALAGTVVGVRQQVMQEEAYLRRTYGADYLAYAGQVGRFLPWLGRLR